MLPSEVTGVDTRRLPADSGRHPGHSARGCKVRGVEEAGCAPQHGVLKERSPAQQHSATCSEICYFLTVLCFLRFCTCLFSTD